MLWNYTYMYTYTYTHTHSFSLTHTHTHTHTHTAGNRMSGGNPELLKAMVDHGFLGNHSYVHVHVQYIVLHISHLYIQHVYMHYWV